jgi:hypothetical protein
MLSKKEIGRRITTIRKNDATLRDRVHEVLCNIAGHAFEHGDVSQFDALFSATSGLNKEAMMTWVHDNGFARYDKKADGFRVNKSMRKESDFTCGEEVVEYLLTQPKWYEAAKSNSAVAAALDVAKRIEALAKAIEKARNEHKDVVVDFAAYKNAQDHLASAMRLVA